MVVGYGLESTLRAGVWGQILGNLCPSEPGTKALGTTSLSGSPCKGALHLANRTSEKMSLASGENHQCLQPQGVGSQPWHIAVGAGSLCCGGCPMPCRRLSSIPGLCPVNASGTTTPLVTNQNVSRHIPMSSVGQKLPSLRTISLGQGGEMSL